MPEIIELPFDYSTLSLSEEDEFRTRSPGLHLTDITKAMLIEAGLAKWKTDPDPNKRKMQFEKGFLWERIIQHCLKIQMEKDIKASDGLLYRPGEYTANGVIGTPDALNIAEGCLEEWKATAISPKNLCRDNLFYEKPEWKWAAAWHCLNLNTTAVVFRIWHHREFDPTIKQYKASFTPDELRNNQEKLINFANYKGMLTHSNN
jgi:hypothetical protein